MTLAGNGMDVPCVGFIILTVKLACFDMFRTSQVKQSYFNFNFARRRPKNRSMRSHMLNKQTVWCQESAQRSLKKQKTLPGAQIVVPALSTSSSFKFWHLQMQTSWSQAVASGRNYKRLTNVYRVESWAI